MKLPELVEGTFLLRLSRFSCEVRIKDKVCKAYVPNSGRMKELLERGRRVYLSHTFKEGRTTEYDLALVDYEGTLVSVDSRVPNLLLAELFFQGKQPFWARNELAAFKKEAVFLKSRFDFRLEMHGLTGYENEVAFLEAKSVTLVRDGVAMFPDAPTERGSKHLLELIEAIKQGYKAAVVFVIQRSDAVAFSPNISTDPDFAKNLWLAKEKGVNLFAYKCEIARDQIKLKHLVPVGGGPGYA